MPPWVIEREHQGPILAQEDSNVRARAFSIAYDTLCSGIAVI